MRYTAHRVPRTFTAYRRFYTALPRPAYPRTALFRYRVPVYRVFQYRVRLRCVQMIVLRHQGVLPAVPYRGIPTETGCLGSVGPERQGQLA